METPGEQDREGHLVQLHPVPVRLTVQPEVLVEPTVRSLRGRQINQRAQRCLGVPGGQQPAGAVDKVAGPDQMVAAEFLIPLRVSPGDAQRRNHRPRVRLVLVGQQQALTSVVESAAVLRHTFQGQEVPASSAPLLDESAALARKGKPERLKQGGDGTLEGVTKRHPQSELPPLAQVEFTGQRYVAVRSVIKLPI